ncbi:hypothetical protein ELQ92_12395 [Labedella populi]|uniref:Uncharacterized protein n=1 Tax=Labedella populi TaxID=2498850 RepID=A0A444Q6U0_9MICO|nr:hypothetical protein [Labedella populi]RWZ59620.1 hypothetical protein ELQ92_12395 [Labedella populi]
MHSRSDRLARGTTAAAIATLVAALSHTIGGGTFPSAPLLALAFITSIGWCTALVGRRFSWPRVSVAVIASQALFHGTFALTGSGGARVVAETGGHAGHGGSTVLTVVPGEIGHLHDGPSMLVAHGVAAVVTIVALRLADRSSRATAALSRIVRSLLPLLVAAPVAVGTRATRVRPDGSGFRPARAAALLGGLRHRGPPVLIAA